MNAPARGYSWAPFEPGNTAAVKHGAMSPRIVDPIAAEIRAELLSVAPWVAVPAFAASVEAWAHAEAQARLLRHFLAEHGVLDDKGEPRNAARFLNAVEARAERARGRLGLDPSSWAQLHRAMSDTPGASTSVEALRATGRQMLEASAHTDDDTDNNDDEAQDGPDSEEGTDGAEF